MEEIIAKKYANALIKTYPQNILKNIFPSLCDISNALSIQKCQEIVHSPYITKQAKTDFILSLLKHKESEIFIKILSQNNRIEIIPFITKALKKHFMDTEKKYEAILYVAQELDSATISTMTNNLSKKLNVDIAIKQCLTKIDGIKLIVQDLGIEISFAKERFFENLKSHILKAI
ncbi:F0F1 ATP synthase subunit delta [Helicobacter fennelliae]|uniref:ATP synthase subunit delta n=1 Tax=Helicobacter fennelliae TaxID=215 RepID=A0A2X3B0V9_9HELI|nr:F0F1 ATP synthase subunit delta [Helicobacter fennelliae]SQB98818.1 F0F1 ATP synthase subunit delta [Helicobacter fennelliae]